MQELEDGRVELVPRNSISNMDFLLSLSEAKGAMGHHSNESKKTRDEDIDLILSDTRATETNDIETKKDNTVSTDNVDDFFLEKINTNNNISLDEVSKEGETCTNASGQNNNKDNDDDDDDEDIENIPTLDNLAISSDKAEILDFRLRVEQLPSLDELNAQVHDLYKKRNDGIDLSVLINQLIPEDHVMEDRDETWSSDSLLSDIKAYFHNRS